MRTFSVTDRRLLLVARHHLGGGAAGPEQVVRDLVALHATDPATVALSVLARSAGATPGDVSSALNERRSLVRWMAMRRTLFVVARDDVALVQAAAGAEVAATLRRQLVSRLERNGSTPAIHGDVARWLAGIEEEVATALAQHGAASGAQLGREVTALRTTIAAGAPSERPQNLTTPLLTLMGAEGRIVRGGATGAWTSRAFRWEPVSAQWPDGLPQVDGPQARVRLARRWLERFGPGTFEDLHWWTGWNKTTTRRVLEGLAVEEVDLHGAAGIALVDDQDASADLRRHEPVAALLPALDPTPMGYVDREWFLGVDRSRLFDRAGNIGPTIWWNGEIVGSWAVSGDGAELRTSLLTDRGTEARRAVDRAAAALLVRLGGVTITPAVSTPLERSLRGGAPGRRPPH